MRKAKHVPIERIIGGLVEERNYPAKTEHDDEPYSVNIFIDDIEKLREEHYHPLYDGELAQEEQKQIEALVPLYRAILPECLYTDDEIERFATAYYLLSTEYNEEVLGTKLFGNLERSVYELNNFMSIRKAIKRSIFIKNCLCEIEQQGVGEEMLEKTLTNVKVNPTDTDKQYPLTPFETIPPFPWLHRDIWKKKLTYRVKGEDEHDREMRAEIEDSLDLTRRLIEVLADHELTIYMNIADTPPKKTYTDKLLTVDEAATIMNTGHEFVIKRCKDGKLPHINDNGNIYIRLSNILAGQTWYQYMNKPWTETNIRLIKNIILTKELLYLMKDTGDKEIEYKDLVKNKNIERGESLFEILKNIHQLAECIDIEFTLVPGDIERYKVTLKLNELGKDYADKIALTKEERRQIIEENVKNRPNETCR